MAKLYKYTKNGIFVEHIIQKVEEIEDQDTIFFYSGGLGIG